MLNVPDCPDTRFIGPVPLSQQIERARLLPLIVRAGGTLTLLSAPAGFGKSTVMAQTCAQLSQAGIATDFAFEQAGEQLGETVFQHQPDPAHQHQYRDPTGQAFLAIDQDEATDTGDETTECDDPGIALDQFDEALDVDRHGGIRRGL